MSKSLEPYNPLVRLMQNILLIRRILGVESLIILIGGLTMLYWKNPLTPVHFITNWAGIFFIIMSIVYYMVMIVGLSTKWIYLLVLASYIFFHFSGNVLPEWPSMTSQDNVIRALVILNPTITTFLDRIIIERFEISWHRIN